MLLLVAVLLSGPAVAGPDLAEAWVSPLASFRIRPIAGLRPVPEETPEVEVVFVGYTKEHGPLSMNVIFFPGDPDVTDFSEPSLRRVQSEVVRSMDRAQPLEVRALPPEHPDGPGFELDFLLVQMTPEGEQAMFMIQRQVHAPDGVYNITLFCLEAQRERLREAIQASLDSFEVLDETRNATPEELVLDATFRFSQGQLEDALELAGRVGPGDPFPARVAASRLRMAASLALGRLAEVEGMILPFIELWARDDRPFSAHYAWLLRRGRHTYKKDLEELAAEGLPADVGATLAGVALTRWAGPPDQIPPRLTRVQDEFYAALKDANFRHPRDDAANWAAIGPALDRAVKEVSEFLVRYEAQAAVGAVTPTWDAPDFQWITSALPMALAHAVHAGARARYADLLARYRRVLARLPGAGIHDPVAPLEAAADGLFARRGAPYRELDFRMRIAGGEALIEQARMILEQGGFAALDERLSPLQGP